MRDSYYLCKIQTSQGESLDDFDHVRTLMTCTVYRGSFFLDCLLQRKHLNSKILINWRERDSVEGLTDCLEKLVNIHCTHAL